MTNNRIAPQNGFGTLLLVHNHYRQRGGEDQVFQAEVQLLRERGHEVVEYVLDNREIGSGMGPAAAAAAVWSRRAYRDIRELIGRHHPDIAHFHNTQPLISPAGYYAAAAMGVPVVQTLHNYRFACVNGLLFREGRVCSDCVGRSLAWRGILRRCYRGSLGGSATVAAVTASHRALGTWTSKVDAYIALSRFSRRKFVEAGLPEGRIAVKPNFLMTPAPECRRDEGYLIYIGRLSAEKGIDTLLAAWERGCPKAELRIVGDGPLADLVRAARDRIPSIRWLGTQPRERVFEELGGARAAILSSTCYENFPMTLIEAGMAGIPCIASDHGALSELVTDGETGLLFPPGDAAQLAERIGTALSEPDRMAEMGRTVRRRFIDLFSPERNYDELMRIYRDARDAAVGAGPRIADGAVERS